ncbi:MAG: PQQ-binding-like beta-propeller repeat protein [Candidatus Caldarchaeum sp.]
MKKEKILQASIIATLITILALPVALAQQQAVDWALYNAVPGNWNWSPQKELNKENIKFLEVKWVFPVPGAPATDPVFGTSQGVIHTPLVYKGVVYLVTNWNRVYALDAATGKTLWFKDLPPYKSWTDVIQSKPGEGPFEPLDVLGLIGHYHQIHIYEFDGRPYLMFITNYWSLIALDPFTGDLRLNLTVFSPDYLRNIPGNRGFYDVSTPSFTIDTKRRILITGIGTSEAQSAGRGFYVGVDLKPWLEGRGNPQIIWRTFIIPPQDGSDPEWTLRLVDQMRGAWIWDGTRLVNVKTLPAEQKRQLLYDDWGFARFVQQHPNERVSYAGAGAGWGGAYAVDEERGLVFVGTNQPSPDWNATFRPGPNLWSSSVLAFNVETGQIVWGVQTMPHDIWDWDCAWSILFLKNVNIGGQRQDVVVKGCKNGVIYALNPDDGSLFWAFNSWHPAAHGGDPRYGVKPTKYSIFLNPLNPRDMAWKWQGEWTTGEEYEYLKRHGSFYQNPASTGAFEMDAAYDPSRNLLYVAVYNMLIPTAIRNVGPGTTYFGNNGRLTVSLPATPTNTTIYAIDVNTGRVKWNTFIPNVPYRGGLTTSNGLLFATFNDGTFRIYDADTGEEIRSIVVGGPMLVQPSIASDSAGKIRLFVPISIPLTRWGPTTNLPGFVVSLGLPDVVAERTIVQTLRSEVTRVQTQVQTQVQTLVTTRVTEVAVEVIPSWVYVLAAVAVLAVVGAAATAARARRK